MPKIESIRPGDTLDATFAAYPLADLLLGILRGNLSGRLDVFLHPEPRNRLHFRDGVPVVVDLPDGPVALLQLLVTDGHISQPSGLELMRLAEGTGTTPLEILRQEGLFPQVELHRVHVQWARTQLVQLFDAGAVEFRFTEGVAPDDDEELTILQPLPIVYEGLHKARDRSVVRRFLAHHLDSKFTLADTYPSDVDPFEWGPDIEATVVGVLRQPAGLADLEAVGMAPDRAVAVLTALHMTDMVDVREAGRPRSVGPRAPSAPVAEAPTPVEAAPETVAAAPIAVATAPRASASTVSAETGGPVEAQGLVVHRRSGEPLEARPSIRVHSVRPATPAGGGDSKVGGNAHDREYVAVRDRLTPYFGQNYYQILRVTAETDAAQLDRAYRFLVRRLEEDVDRQGARPVLDLIHEAYEVLKEAESSRRYALLVERGEKLSPADRERKAFEAEPKVDRAVRAMGDGRTGEATLLLSWAERLDPSRTDLGVYFGVLDVIRAPDGQRAADARALRGVVQEQLSQRAYDWRLKLCLGLVLAEDGDYRGANRVLDQTPERTHPMAARIAALVDTI